MGCIPLGYGGKSVWIFPIHLKLALKLFWLGFRCFGKLQTILLCLKENDMTGFDTFFTIYIMFVSLLFGVVFGSFLNCVAYRLVRGENPFKGRSHCTSCGHTLGLLDLIPLFSYVILKGRCRYCKAKFSKRYFLTELFMGVVFATTVYKYGISLFTLQYIILFCILFLISLIDIETYEIPNVFLVLAIINWAVFLPFLDSPLFYISRGLKGAVAIGGGIFILSLIMDILLKKESMGGGDIKLFFVLGLYLGIPLGLLNLIISCFVGLFIIFIMKQNKIPFGPAISIATWITLICGSEIISWYLGLFL